MKKIFDVTAKIGGVLVVLLLLASLTMPDAVADAAGRFHSLFFDSGLKSYNWGKAANFAAFYNKDKTMRLLVDSTGAFHGTTNFAGVKLFGHAAAVDTLVLPGLSFDTTTSVNVTPFLTVSADTTLIKGLWARPSSYINSDTIYVFQTTTSALRAIKYSYSVVQVK
jgi:hypothetical protein